MRIVAQLLADMADMYVNRAGLAIELIPPDAVEQEIAGKHLAAGDNQQLEQLELLQGQRQLLTVAESFVVAGVDYQRAYAQYAFLVVLSLSAP